MGRGNPGASTSVAALEPQDDSPERKRENEKGKEGRVEGGQKERHCLVLCSPLKAEQVERKERSQERT